MLIYIYIYHIYLYLYIIVKYIFIVVSELLLFTALEGKAFITHSIVLIVLSLLTSVLQSAYFQNDLGEHPFAQFTLVRLFFTIFVKQIIFSPSVFHHDIPPIS